MKPIIISTACIVFLISVWTFFYCFSGNVLNNLSDELTGPVYSIIDDEKWEEAQSKIHRVSHVWEKNKTIFYMLSNHAIIRETDLSLARLKEYVRNKERSDAHAEIGALSELMLSIRQSEAFTLDNIL